MFQLRSGPRADQVLQRELPLGLLGLSFALAGLGRQFVPVGAWPWLVGMGLLLAINHLSDPSRLPIRTRRVLWALSTLPTLGLVVISPFFAFYAASLVLSASVLSAGGRLVPYLLPGALIISLGQLGGGQNLRHAWPLYLVLVMANLALYATFIRFGHVQERNLAERDAALRDLEQAQQEKALLQARLVEQAHTEGVLEERARLAREIHDTVAQGLIGIITQLQGIDGSESPEARAERLSRAEESARESLAEARRAVRALASPRLDGDDLPAALDRLVADWTARSGIPAAVRVVGPALGGGDDPTLLRICQEGLANVARHAHARSVDVELSYTAYGVGLVVSDDGRGFDPASTGGHGLPGMRQRAVGAGGSLDLVTAPGEGTTVRVLVPYDGPDRELPSGPQGLTA